MVIWRYVIFLFLLSTLSTLAQVQDHKVTLLDVTTNNPNELIIHIVGDDLNVKAIYELRCDPSMSSCVTPKKNVEYLLKSEQADTLKCQALALYQGSMRIGLYCLTSVRVKQASDLIVTCSANPMAIKRGGSTTIEARVSGKLTGNLIYTFGSSLGTITVKGGQGGEHFGNSQHSGYNTNTGEGFRRDFSGLHCSGVKWAQCNKD